MSSSDVRAILNLPQAGQAGPSQPPRRSVPVKKPEGISRELYALIGDNAPSLAEAQASLAAFKYRERPKLKSKAVKWCVARGAQKLIRREWMRFTPVGKDGLGLGHWVRSDEEPDARGGRRKGVTLTSSGIFWQIQPTRTLGHAI
jgi:DNA methyltransferase 1-associated protein 1